MIGITNKEELNRLQAQVIEKLLNQKHAFAELCEFGPFGIEHSLDMSQILDCDWVYQDPPTMTFRQRLLQIDGIDVIKCLRDAGEEKMIRLFVLKRVA